MDIDRFEMERYQSRYWHLVDHDLSESGVLPMTIRELLGPAADAEAFLAGTALGYPLSEGSFETRANVATWYPDATADHVTIVNGGSEANFLALWTLLEPGDRLAFMIPNYLQGWGLGRHFGKATDTFRLKLREGGWQLDLDGLDAAVGKRTKAIMVCNPNNPTGHVLTDEEMGAVVTAADRVGAWIVADEIYRGAELDTDVASPTFWGRYDRVIVTSGLSKAFAMPGLRVGWAVSTPEMLHRIWERHDYTTLTPGMVSDRLAALAMLPDVRESILTRTRTIIRENYPSLESWLGAHGDVFTWARPRAGAIQYAKYDLPISSTKLVERIREQRSVLLVPGDMFGLGKGIRFGFGYDIERTMKALALVDEVLAEVGASRRDAT
jgi:aspartate/methionine/tyrosine aminotransferase